MEGALGHDGDGEIQKGKQKMFGEWWAGLGAFAGQTGLTWEIFLRLAASLAAGSLVGLERYQRGHPAGVRTYALVCFASAMLMAGLEGGAYRQLLSDSEQGMGASRVVQGILSGIGFIGAGVIVREGLSVKGLTTAASIWVTAGIGIMIGAGDYALGAVSAVLTLFVLMFFRVFDRMMPRRSFSILTARFVKDSAPTEAKAVERLESFGFKVEEVSFRGSKNGALEIKAYVWISANPREARSALAQDLRDDATVIEFSIEPVSD